MTPRRGVLIMPVLAAALVLPACKSKTTYDSPQAVFDAAAAASAKQDWAGFMNCLTDESQDKFTFSLAVGAISYKFFASMDREKGAEAAKAIDEALKKHGVNEADLPDLGKDMFKMSAPQDEREMMRKVLGPIKDKPAFVADIIAAMKKLVNKEPQQKFAGTLTNVKIEGDNATATVVRKTPNKETQGPMAFRKVGGGWKIELFGMPMGGMGSK